MHLFYVPDIAGDTFELGPEESRHAMQVLRMKTGDSLRLTDGRGLWCTGEIEPGSTAKACRIRIGERKEQHGKLPYRLHLGIAPTKNGDRYEWFLEKATEIGVSRITPLLCDHSERKTVKHDRGEKVLVSAMKQSMKAYLPELEEMTPFRTFIEAVASTESQQFIGHVDESLPLEKRIGLFDAIRPGGSYIILIGPEGDFSPAEIEVAEAAGFVPVTLGDTRLRTETAGLVVTTLAAAANRNR